MRLSIARGLGRSLAAAALLALAACSGNNEAPSVPSAPATGGGVTAFVGARVIVGDGTVIENATFTLGPDKHFGLVGSTAAVTLPAGVRKVDMTGLTVMPAIVDAHTHLSRERDALIADLKHRAYFGVSAALSLGQDNGSDVFVVRKEVIPGAALYRLAGRGITAPEPGRSDIRIGSRPRTKRARPSANRPLSASTSSRFGWTTASASTRSSRRSCTAPRSTKRTRPACARSRTSIT